MRAPSAVILRAQYASERMTQHAMGAVVYPYPNQERRPCPTRSTMLGRISLISISDLKHDFLTESTTIRWTK